MRFSWGCRHWVHLLRMTTALASGTEQCRSSSPLVCLHLKPRVSPNSYHLGLLEYHVGDEGWGLPSKRECQIEPYELIFEEDCGPSSPASASQMTTCGFPLVGQTYLKMGYVSGFEGCTHHNCFSLGRLECPSHWSHCMLKSVVILCWGCIVIILTFGFDWRLEVRFE